MASYSTNLTVKKKFFKKAYYKALLSFWRIKKGSLVRNHFGICKIESITENCRLVLKLVQPLSPDKLSVNNLDPKKMSRNVTILNITTKDGESLFAAENYLEFRQTWERKKFRWEKTGKNYSRKNSKN